MWFGMCLQPVYARIRPQRLILVAFRIDELLVGGVGHFGFVDPEAVRDGDGGLWLLFRSCIFVFGRVAAHQELSSGHPHLVDAFGVLADCAGGKRRECWCRRGSQGRRFCPVGGSGGQVGCVFGLRPEGVLGADRVGRGRNVGWAGVGWAGRFRPMGGGCGLDDGCRR